MENWVGIASLVVSLGIAGVMIYMYKKGKMPESDISNIAGLIRPGDECFERARQG